MVYITLLHVPSPWQLQYFVSFIPYLSGMVTTGQRFSLFKRHFCSNILYKAEQHKTFIRNHKTLELWEPASIKLTVASRILSFLINIKQIDLEKEIKNEVYEYLFKPNNLISKRSIKKKLNKKIAILICISTLENYIVT